MTWNTSLFIPLHAKVQLEEPSLKCQCQAKNWEMPGPLSFAWPAHETVLLPSPVHSSGVTARQDLSVAWTNPPKDQFLRVALSPFYTVSPWGTWGQCRRVTPLPLSPVSRAGVPKHHNMGSLAASCLQPLFRQIPSGFSKLAWLVTGCFQGAPCSFISSPAWTEGFRTRLAGRSHGGLFGPVGCMHEATINFSANYIPGSDGIGSWSLLAAPLWLTVCLWASHLTPGWYFSLSYTLHQKGSRGSQWSYLWSTCT